MTCLPKHVPFTTHTKTSFFLVLYRSLILYRFRETFQNSKFCLYVSSTEWKDVLVSLHRINYCFLVSSWTNLFPPLNYTDDKICLASRCIQVVRTKASLSSYPWLSGGFLDPNGIFCSEKLIAEKWWIWESLAREVLFYLSSAQQAPLRWKCSKIDAWTKPGSSHLTNFERALNLPVGLTSEKNSFP